MKIIIPLAGKGSRFQPNPMPKPLIEIGGKPMIQWPIESLYRLYPQASPKDFIFICLSEHEKKFKISKALKKLAGEECTIRFIPGVTEGPVCTVLSIEDLIDTREDMLTCDCDQYFICPNFKTQRERAIANGWGGLIPTDEKESTAYSYVRLDKKGNAVETAEKKLISTHAAIGIYYFTKGSSFVWAAKQMVRKNIKYNNEFYMCPVYNELIQRGDIVRIVPTQEWMTLGTPKEAELFIEKKDLQR